MFKFINIIFFFLINVANCFANEDIYFIENNPIFLENDGNVLELREKAKNISFQNAFDILTKNILDPVDISKLQQISEINLEELVKDYKIQSEKITDINYFSEISVNFNSSKLKEFFLKNNIKLNIFVSESYLIFPIFKKFNTYYLWEEDNYWYDYLFQEYDKQSLLKLFFPKKNHLNKLKISANQILDEDSDLVAKFLNSYKRKKAIIVFLEENFDHNKNIFSIKLETKVFSNNGFDNIYILKNNMLPEDTNNSQVELIAKLVVNELQNWWKNKIENLELKKYQEKTYFLSFQTSNLKNTIFVENKLKEILSEKNFFIHELTAEKVTYKINTNYSIEQLNLALEVSNLRLKQNNNDDWYSIEYY